MGLIKQHLWQNQILQIIFEYQFLGGMCSWRAKINNDFYIINRF